jgi:CDP-diacylglycerol--glycerol-3-phosphate 3-phosphatidyltransferase
LIALVELRFISSIPVIIILAREFLVTGLRLGAMDKGTVVAANIWGKLKMVLQCIGIALSYISIYIACLAVNSSVPLNNGNLTIIPNIVIWICAIFTAISAIPYFIAGKDYLKS